MAHSMSGGLDGGSFEPSPEPVSGLAHISDAPLYTGEDGEDIDHAVQAAMDEPPDPVDALLAHQEEQSGPGSKGRPLDFVRLKMRSLKQENKKLRDRVQDLEQTLSIVQTAQEWTLGKGMTQEQSEKMKEIKHLLEQAKKAREDMHNFSNVGRAALYEKLRSTKLQLKKEREDKAEMRQRLVHAFEHARLIKEQHKQVSEQQLSDRQQFQDTIRNIKERHRVQLARLHGDETVQAIDRQEQFSNFGEQVMQELSALQQHLHDVKQGTVDTVLLEEDDLEGPDGDDDDGGDFEP